MLWWIRWTCSTLSRLFQHAVDRVVGCGSVDVLQDLVHSGRFWSARQNHPLLVFRAHAHPADEAPPQASETQTSNQLQGNSSMAALQSQVPDWVFLLTKLDFCTGTMSQWFNPHVWSQILISMCQDTILTVDITQINFCNILIYEFKNFQ